MSNPFKQGDYVIVNFPDCFGMNCFDNGKYGKVVNIVDDLVFTDIVGLPPGHFSNFKRKVIIERKNYDTGKIELSSKKSDSLYLPFTGYWYIKMQNTNGGIKVKTETAARQIMEIIESE